MNDIKYLTVSAITKYIKHILENNQHLQKIYLKGEISNLTKHSRGHFYFTLKDEQSQIRCVMFQNYASKVSFNPKDGDKVLVLGQISVYEAGGSYSLNIYTMEPDGIGDLYLAYEKLKKELQEKGYFDQKYKKPIPKYPARIGVVTSPTGAAIKDIIHTIERRYPLAEVILYPAIVQGNDSKISIKNCIEKANQDDLVDTLIVGRGGGSIEDLWAFNELIVIEAIFKSRLPIITGIGHETDFTISDFVSDLRAPTPTAAAELATPNKDELLSRMNEIKLSLYRNFNGRLDEKKVRLMHVEEHLMAKSPIERINKQKEKQQELSYLLNRNYKLLVEYKKDVSTYLDKRLKSFNLTQLIKQKEKTHRQLDDRLKQQINYVLESKAQQFILLKEQLKHLNPLSYMDKGYSISLLNDKKIASVDDVEINDTLETILTDGKVYSVVQKKEKNHD